MNPELVRGKIILCSKALSPKEFGSLGDAAGVLMQANTRDAASLYSLPAATLDPIDFPTIYGYISSDEYVYSGPFSVLFYVFEFTESICPIHSCF